MPPLSILKTNSQRPKITHYFEGVLHLSKILLFIYYYYYFPHHSARFHVVAHVNF